MALTDTAIKNAKPRERAYKMFDAGGLYLLVAPTGHKRWRFKYRFGGKEKLLALGVYPDVLLLGHKDPESGEWIDGAREKREQARKLIASNIDPSVARKAQRNARDEAGANSFEVVAREWHAQRKKGWAANTAQAKLDRLESDVFPTIGRHPIRNLRAPDLLKVLQKIEKRGAVEIARRVRQVIGQVYRYAIATGRVDLNPVHDLKDALPPPDRKHYAAITDPKAVGALIRAIRGYQGEPVTCAALHLAPLLFVRPGELRCASWDEFDLKAAEWRIPAGRMKMRVSHLVPLSRQAVEILGELHHLSGHNRKSNLVFPGVRSKARPLSENTLNAALRRMGYTADEMTSHGFRSMASTLLNEQGWHHDAIERQLAHSDRDETRSAYNRSEHLPERKRMMQAWADYLDGLASGADVVPLKRTAN